jgi:hypothetical protein
MTYAPPARFEIARVLSRMTGVIGRNFPVFAILALTLNGLPHLALAIFERGFFSPLGLAAIGPFGMGWILNLLIGALLQAALIHGTVSDLDGKRASLGDCLNTAFRHVLPLIGIGIATTVATFTGLLLFIVPGIILALALCVSAPVRVVEGLGVFNSMGRSGDLTRNHRGALLLLFILYGVGFSVLQSVVGAIPLAAEILSSGATQSVGRLIISPLLQAFGALVGAAGVASIYFELRTIKEGVGIEALAAAFD